MNRVFGGLGLPIEPRDNKSVCTNDYIITTTGYDLVLVLDINKWIFTVCRFDGKPFDVNVRYTGNRTIYKRIALANLYGYQCMACGNTKDLTMDHVIPRADNGWGSLSNLQLLCKRCNVAKADNYVDYRFLTPSEIFWIWADEWATDKIVTRVLPFN